MQMLLLSLLFINMFFFLASPVFDLLLLALGALRNNIIIMQAIFFALRCVRNKGKNRLQNCKHRR